MDKPNDDFEKMTFDTNDELNVDIKINPDFYIHHALVNAQKCFNNPNAESGFSQYILFIEHIENLCLASGMLIKEEYEKGISEFKEKPEYKEEKKIIIKNVRMANKKLSLLMESVFRKKTLTDPMKG